MKIQKVALFLVVVFLLVGLINLPVIKGWLKDDEIGTSLSDTLLAESNSVPEVGSSGGGNHGKEGNKVEEQGGQVTSFSFMVSPYNETHYSLINGTDLTLEHISSDAAEVINFAIANASTISGTVHIQNGTYRLTRPIIPKSYVYVYSPQAVFLEYNSSLLPPQTLAQTFNMLAHDHQTYPLYNFTLDGGIWDGQRGNLEITNDTENAAYGGQSNGIYIYSDPPNGGYGIAIKNLVVRNVIHFGVAIFLSEHSLVENVTTINVGHNGITIDAGSGVYSNWNHDAVVKNSYAEYSGDVGINVFYGRGVQFINNVARNNTSTASPRKSNWGFASEFANDISFINNKAFNQDRGIRVNDSENVTLIGNGLNGNIVGVSIDFSSNITVSANNSESNKFGIDLNNSTFASFFLNNIIVNTKQVKLYGDQNVTWDNGSQGNYWSDYEQRYPYAKELDGSGIWDTPYIIDDYNRDRYPLTNPWPMTFPIIWEETTYLVSIASNSTIFQLGFNQLGRRISFDVIGPNDTAGFCNVTIPKALLDAPQDEWIVIVGSESPQPSVVSNITHSSIYFTYTRSIQTVNVIGTNPIDNTLPIANAGPDQTVNEDTWVTLNGSASWDNIEIATCTWFFTDEVPQTLNGINPTYSFATPGIFTIILNITDLRGNYDVDTVIVTVLDVTNPLANAGPDQIVDEDINVSFDGATSSDNVKIVTYVWSFVDGTLKTLTEISPAYTFETPGIYDVTLDITDAAGNWATDSMVVTVLDVTAPVANAGQNQTVNQETTVSFDGYGSYDNVAITSYAWTFLDTKPQRLTGVNPPYLFKTPGYYLVTLNVTDARGNWDIDTITVTVLDTKIPLALFSVSPKEEQLYAGRILTFDADNSTDNVGIVGYLWDFGDGKTGEGKIVTHVYSDPGIYIVELEVKDAAGNVGTYSLALEVFARESHVYDLLIVVILAGVTLLLLSVFLKRQLNGSRFWKKEKGKGICPPLKKFLN